MGEEKSEGKGRGGSCSGQSAVARQTGVLHMLEMVDHDCDRAAGAAARATRGEERMSVNAVLARVWFNHAPFVIFE